MRTRKGVVRRRREEPLIKTQRSTNIGKRVGRWICVALVALAVLPYLQTLRYEFVNLDDGMYVAENPVVQQGLTWSNVTWAFTTLSTGNWHPLTWLSHMVDCQIFGLQPGWHHLENALLHGANTALLFVVFWAMTGMVWRSGLVAALFAVHPLHVESVAWIAERKDLLSAFFGLSAIGAYLRFVRAPSLRRYGLVVCFFALSLLSKPMLVTLPFVLLLLDVWPLKRFSVEDRVRIQDAKKLWRLILAKLPLLAMSAASSVVTFKAQLAGGAVVSMEALPLSQRLANAVVAYAGYCSKAFWPINLAGLYPRPAQTSVVNIAAAILLIVGVSIGVAVLIRKRPWLAVGWFWFLGTLVPVIGLVQVGVQSMADRYTYVPLIGVFIMIAWSIPPAAFAASNRGLVRVATAVAALILTALAGVTFAQIPVWKNTITLFDHAVKVTEGNFVAYNGLGVAKVSLGRIDEGISDYRHALKLNPNYADAFANLGTALSRQGKYDEAIEMCETAVRLRPDLADMHADLGAVLLYRDRIDEAIFHNRKAVELDRDLLEPRLNLGLALFKKGNYDEAIAQLEYVLRVNPQYEIARTFLAAAKGKREEAGSRP